LNCASILFCFFLIGIVFVHIFGFTNAAGCSVKSDSALIPMAQMNPTRSHPIAAMVFLCLCLLPSADVALVQAILRPPYNLGDLG
jgi:hypothetical protein